MTDYATALKMARLVQIAGIEGSYEQKEFDAIAALGYSFQQEIWGSALGETASFGYVALSAGGECVVALRGTDPKRVLELFDDALAVLVPNPFGHGFVHLGFKQVYESLHIPREPKAENMTPVAYVKSLLDSKQATSVTVCGHSLGGAVATPLAADIFLGVLYGTPPFTIQVFTFGSPRVGDHEYADRYNVILDTDTQRFENWLDPIPNLPPRPPFEHVDTKVQLRGGLKLDPLGEHFISEYIALIEAKV